MTKASRFLAISATKSFVGKGMLVGTKSPNTDK